MKLFDSRPYAIVIGGGFFGVNIALHLAKQHRGQVVLIEKENSLFARASYHNQARVHNGYHYPRSFTTAYRSRINLPRFVLDWQSAIKKDFTNLYAIARNNSKVTASQFTRFCRDIGAKIEPAEGFSDLFDDRLIERSFLVEEYSFDACVLKECAKSMLEEENVEVFMNAKVTKIRNKSNGLAVSYEHDEIAQELTAERVFNCTYSGLNQFGVISGIPSVKLKHEIAEIALIKMPSNLQNISVTVMDGPFFSIMPFPDKGLHTLSHVRYTPHVEWIDEKEVSPYEKLIQYGKQSRADRMLRDARRYMPRLESAEYCESLFEIKTILPKNEIDDGRPILLEEYGNFPGLFSVLGGKIDNIYDVLSRLNDKLN